MDAQQLIPRQTRKLHAPRKAALYQMVRELSEDVARLRAENERLRAPWWRKLFGRR
jgi:hypothetical protein